jgi:peroxiredoxin
MALAHAALKPGDKAPDFSTEAALGGDSFKFSLGDALKKGPVVLYFYPKAFTTGCTIEAHNFAESSDEFKKMGATLIGMSNDDITTLKKFSIEACRNKFAVAADPGARFAKQYDATLAVMPGMADRITYVIDTDGKVAYTYASMSPDGHVENALKAVAGLKH